MVRRSGAGKDSDTQVRASGGRSSRRTGGCRVSSTVLRHLGLRQVKGMALSYDAVQIGITAVIVLIAVLAAGMILRKKYVRSADFERGIEALRQEFRHSIEAAQTASKRARTVSESLVSVIKPIDSTVTDLNARLARLEEHADATAAYMAASQKRASEENERIAVRLEGLEQQQMALATHVERLDQSLQGLMDQFALINQAIAEARRRDEDCNNSIEAVNARLRNTQTQLVSRLELGEKARSDLGTLISLFVKQLKSVNLNAAQTAVRVADLESQLRSMLGGSEEPVGSIHERENDGSTRNVDGMAAEVIPNAGHRAASLVQNGGEKISDFERPPIPAEDLPNGVTVERESH